MTVKTSTPPIYRHVERVATKILAAWNNRAPCSQQDGALCKTMPCGCADEMARAAIAASAEFYRERMGQ
jgi:hypothetical protein